MIQITDDNLAQAPTGIPVEDGTNTNASTETAKDRGYKVHTVLGDQSPGADVLASKISFGDENGLRTDLANQENARKAAEIIKELKAQAEQGNFPKIEDLSRLSFTPERPETVIEKLWSDKVVNSAVAAKTDVMDPVRQVMEESPDDMMKRVNTAQGVVYRNEIAKTLAQDISDQWENTSWFSADGIGGVLGDFIPLANWAIIKGHTLETGEAKGEWLSGSILQKMATELYSINDPYQFKLKMKENIEKLAVKSIPVAVQYARAMVSYGTSDEFLDNAFNVIDAVSLVPGGAIVSKAKKVISGSKEEADKALKDLIKANGSLETNPIDLKAASGNTAGAASDLVKERVATFVSRDPGNVSLPLRQNVKSLFNPDVLVQNSTSVAQEMSDRIAVLLRGNADKLTSLFTDLSTVPRIANPEALDKAIESAKGEIGKKYKQAVDGLIDYQVIPPDQTLANVGFVRARVGQSTKTFSLDDLNIEKNLADLVNNDFNINVNRTTARKSQGVTLKEFDPGLLEEEGWFFQEKSKFYKVRIQSNEKTHDLEIGVSFSRDETILKVDGIIFDGEIDSRDSWERLSNTIGISGIRNLLLRLQEEFPRVRHITGERVTGFRSDSNPVITQKMSPVHVNTDDIAEFERLAKSVSQKEKQSDPSTWTPEQTRLYQTGNWKAFSRSRGYTEDEINEYERFINAANAIDEKYGPGTAAGIDYDVNTVSAKFGMLKEVHTFKEDTNGFIINSVQGSRTRVTATNSTGGITVNSHYKNGSSQLYLGKDGELFDAKDVNLIDKASKDQIYIPRSEEEKNQLIYLLKRLFGNEHPDVETAVKIDDEIQAEIKRIVTGQSPANPQISRAKFGTNAAEPFDSAAEAAYWMENEYHLSSSQYKIVSENGKFFGVVDQYLPETVDAVRDSLIDTGSTTPRTFLGQLLDAARLPNFRGGDEIVSRTEMAVRKLATSASQELMRAMAEVAHPTVGTLGKEKYKRLNRLLEIDRAFVGPEGEQGRFLNNLDEYTAQYRSVFKEAPTEEEMAAYFTLRQINDFDYAVRDMGLTRDLARLDVSNHTFSLEGGVPSKSFKAKPVDNLPDWTKDWTALVISPDGKPRKIMSSTATEVDKSLVADRLMNDYKIVQLYEPNIRPLSSVTGDKSIVNFVLAPKFDTEKLTFGNLPHRPGGHREYVSKNFVKQAKISDYGGAGKKLYEGDTVALAFETKAEAVKYTERMETARKLLNEGKDKELAKYLANNLPFKLDQFKKYFMEYTDEAGNIIERRFDPNEPFRYVDNQNNIYNQYGLSARQDLVNLADNEFNLAAENDRRFLAQRDPELWTIKEVRDQGGLIHEIQGARQLDPLASITRTMRSVMESRFTNDYKIGAIERWIAEFGDTMKVSKEDLRRNPSYYFQNPEFNENYGNKAMLAAAKQSLTNIKNFLGVETAVDKMVNTLTQRLADTIYGVAGQRVSDFTAEKLATVDDPSRYFRGMAFHTNMGFGNPIQIAVQGQTAFVISAISPKHGPVASMYALASQLTALTKKEGILRKMEGMLDSLGLDGKVFTESSQEMRKTGWDFVGGESMWSEGTLQPKVFTNKVGNFLDAGTVFFKGTERWLRLSGWHTAFREFREANPTKVITDIDRANILNRANTLTVNMTSASKANWEKGILSVPAQFMSYQARLMDMVWGKQLSPAEKARTLGMLAFMYGLPGAGAGVTGYSAYDAMRTYALDNGYDLSGTALAGILEGIPHLVAQQMGLGEWNYSSRYGPSGFTAIQDLVEGDKGLIETLMGPSGSIFNQSVKQSSPTLWAISDVLRGDSAAMQLLPQDFIDAARSIATVNSVHNVIMAATAGRYYSKNQVYTADTDWQTMMVSAMTGLQPNEIPDTYLLMKNKKSWDELRKTTDSQYIINFQRGLLAASEGNTDLAYQYWKRARVFLETGHYNPKEQKELYQKAIKNQGSLVAKIKDDYWKNAPLGTEGARLQRTLQGTSTNVDERN